MLFSIIMPVYKTEKEVIINAIKSVEEQTEKEWELLIIDDNFSGSDWKKVIEDLSQVYTNNKIKFFFHDDNKGANAARNTGVKNAQGIYIAFLDADDVWDIDYLETIREKIFHISPDIISCNYRLVTSSRTFDMNPTHPEEGQVYMNLIYSDVIGPTSAVTVLKEKLNEVNGFDTELPARQDYDTWVRICRTGANVGFVDEPKVSIYRTDRESISSRGLNHINGTEKVLEKLLSDIKLEPYHEKIKYSHYYESAIYALRQEESSIARKYLKRTLKCKFSFKVVFIYCMSYFPKGIELGRKIYRKIR